MTARPLESRESHLMGMKENALAMLISSVTRNEEDRLLKYRKVFILWRETSLYGN